MNSLFSFGREDSLCFFLRSKIREYKKAHPNFSSSQLARNWGLSSSSFNRIENLEVRVPNVDQVEKILKGCAKEEEILPILKKYYPSLTSLFEWLLTNRPKMNKESARVVYEDYLPGMKCF